MLISVGVFWCLLFSIFPVCLRSPCCLASERAEPDSCVGSALELLVHPGRPDECFPAV